MPDFTRESNYKEETSFSKVVFGSSAPVLEVELNEVQDIINTKLKRLFNLFSSEGYLYAPNDVGYDSGSRTLTLDQSVVISGDLLAYVADVSFTVPEEHTVVYIALTESTITGEDVIYSYGNTKDGEVINNPIYDNRLGEETSRRKVINYTVSSGTELPTDTEEYKYIHLATIDEYGAIVEKIITQPILEVVKELPNLYAEKHHTHTVSDITDTLPITSGGTGGTERATALYNLSRGGYVKDSDGNDTYDLNLYTDIGYYYFSSLTVPTNAPSTKLTGYLLVLRGYGGGRKQIWMPQTSETTIQAEIYIRTTNDCETWTSWVKLVTEGRATDSDRGTCSVALGENNTASHSYSVAVGRSNTAGANYTSAIGRDNKVTGQNGFAFGRENTVTSGDGAVAIGQKNTIDGSGAWAFGYNNTSSSVHSITCGSNNTSSGMFSVAIGNESEASAEYSVAVGFNTTNNSKSAFVCGRFNKELEANTDITSPTSGDVFVIGNGSLNPNDNSNPSLSNAFRVTYLGSVYGKSAYNSSGADYAEFIKPWFDNNTDNEDRVGYFVTLKDGYLHKANDGDYILGVTSGNPSVVGNSDEEYYWKYERDVFNRYVYEDVEEVVHSLDEEGNLIYNEDGSPVYVKTGNIIKNGRIKLSENYDPTLQDSYIERAKRPEWDYVGMRGIIPVRDDGTCEVGGFCKCSVGGIATKSETRGFDTYFVIERISDNVVSIEVK